MVIAVAGCGSERKGEVTDRAAYERDRYGEPSPRSAPFSKYSGAGRLHLAEFGEEADSDERQAAQKVVVSYLDALTSGEGGKACSRLSTQAQAQIAEAAERTIGFDGRGGCAKAQALLVSTRAWEGGRPPARAPDGIASLRVKEEAGFALFHDSDGQDRWMAMKVEGGEWKLLSTFPLPFR